VCLEQRIVRPQLTAMSERGIECSALTVVLIPRDRIVTPLLSALRGTGKFRPLRIEAQDNGDPLAREWFRTSILSTAGRLATFMTSNGGSLPAYAPSISPQGLKPYGVRQAKSFPEVSFHKTVESHGRELL
jgi:hypothetical protein